MNTVEVTAFGGSSKYSVDENVLDEIFELLETKAERIDIVKKPGEMTEKSDR